MGDISSFQGFSFTHRQRNERERERDVYLGVSVWSCKTHRQCTVMKNLKVGDQATIRPLLPAISQGFQAITIYKSLIFHRVKNPVNQGIHKRPCNGTEIIQSYCRCHMTKNGLVCFQKYGNVG